MSSSFSPLLSARADVATYRRSDGSIRLFSDALALASGPTPMSAMTPATPFPHEFSYAIARRS